jgi:hypothetical protein
MDVTPVIARLRATVPALRSVEGAVELAALMASKPQVQAGVIAHVIPSGQRGGAADVSGSAFIQDVDHVVSVILTFVAPGDRSGARSADTVGATVEAVIASLAGWAPGDTVGVFRLLRSGIQRAEPGLIVTATEFGLADQLRIVA